MNINEKKLKEYNSINIQSLSRQVELGAKNFDEIISIMAELKKLIDEMVDISKITDYPPTIYNHINNYINKFTSFVSQIERYDLDSDGRNDFKQRQKIINDIQNYYEDILSGKHNFLLIYNTIKNFSLKDIQKERQEVEKLKRSLQESRVDVDDTLNLIRQAAGEKTASDYATIFENQAKKHSNLAVTRNFPFLKIGAAQLWLFTGVLSIILLLIIIKILSDDILPTFEIITLKEPNGEFQKVQYIISNIISRILVVGISVFLIGFSFKQHSVNRHLFTINKHRQNALESYQLFITSINKEDTQTRHQLIIEVAKAIYELGSTGYITEKSQNPSSNGIIELTKFINDK